MPAPLRIRVSLIDPDPHYRMFLASHLNASERHLLLNTATTAAEALAWSDRIAPDIVLLETDLPDLPGTELITRLRQRYPLALFLILTSGRHHEQLEDAIHAGATGYLMKSDGRDAVFTAIDEALTGGAPLSRTVARDVLRILRSSQPPFPPE